MTSEDVDGGAEGTGEGDGTPAPETDAGGPDKDAGTPEPQAEAPSWRDHAASEIERIADGDEDYALKAQKAVDRFETAGDLVKSYLSLRDSLDKRVQVPGDKASDEERAAFYERLGKPKSADDYKLTRPEGVPEETPAEQELAKNFKAKAHELNLTSAQVEQLYAWNFEVAALEAKAREVALQKFAEDAEKELRLQWTVDYDRNLELANEALQHYAKDDWQAFKDLRLEDGGYVGDHPVFARIFARVGSDRGEDVRANGAFDGSSRLQDAQSALDAMKDEAISKGKTLMDPEYAAKAEALYKEIYGTRPMSPVGQHSRM